MMNYADARMLDLKGSIAGAVASLGGWALRKTANSKPWNVIGAVIEGLGSVTVAVFGTFAAVIDISEAIEDIANSEK